MPYTLDENVFVGATTGGGKNVSCEQPRAVCIEPYQEMVDQRVKGWPDKFSGPQGGKSLNRQDKRPLEKESTPQASQVPFFHLTMLVILMLSVPVGCTSSSVAEHPGF